MTDTNKTLPTDRVGQQGSVQRARRLRQVSEHYPKRLALFQRVYAGKSSPRECVKAFCLECNGWEEEAIRECCAWACPLHGLRPYQRERNECGMGRKGEEGAPVGQNSGGSIAHIPIKR